MQTLLEERLIRFAAVDLERQWDRVRYDLFRHAHIARNRDWETTGGHLSKRFAGINAHQL
jgi:hypothetical protein